MLDSEKAIFGDNNVIVVSVISARQVEKTAGEMRRRDDDGFATKSRNYGVEAYYVLPSDVARKCVSTCMFASTVDPRNDQLLYILKDQAPVIVHTSKGTNFGYRESNDFDQNVDALLTVFGRDCPVYHFQFAHNAVDGAAYIKIMPSGEKLVRDYGIWNKVVRNDSAFGNDRTIVNQIRRKPWRQWEPELESRLPAYDEGVLADIDAFLSMKSRRIGQNEQEDVFEDDGCMELTDAEQEILDEQDFGGQIRESVNRVVSARFDLTPDEERAGNVYDSNGWNMLEFQGRVGGDRFADGHALLKVFSQILYFRDRDFTGYSDARPKFANSPGFAEFAADAFQPAGFIVGFDLREGKTVTDIDSAIKQLRSGKPGRAALTADEVKNADGLEIDLDNVQEKPSVAWHEVKAGETVPAKDAFLFDYAMMVVPTKKFVYSAHIDSMNMDDKLSYDDQVVSDRPLSIEQIFTDLWKRVPKGFNVSPDMKRAHEEFNRKVKAIEDAGLDKAETAIRLMQIPFPVIKELYYGSSDDGIAIVPTKEMCEKLAEEGTAAGYFENDSATELKFNKIASDRIWVRSVVAPGFSESEKEPNIKPFFKENERPVEESEQFVRTFEIESVEFDKDWQQIRALESREDEADVLEAVADEMNRAEAFAFPTEVQVFVESPDISEDDLKEVVLDKFNSDNGFVLYPAVSCEFKEELDESSSPLSAEAVRQADGLPFFS